MAILKIARMGHPVLRRAAAPVEDPAIPEIRSLAEDMLDTLADAGGVGLAAPQVHVGLRVVIVSVPAARSDTGSAIPPTVLINPEIEALSEEMAQAFEGCLSIPEMIGAVPRHTRIRYRAQGLGGEIIEGEAQGFFARVLQHECDHLDGILYPLRMTDLTMFGFNDEMRRAIGGEERNGA